eukprot:scaffold54373_cov48-Phaeocystis_antarctica.AAC.2
MGECGQAIQSKAPRLQEAGGWSQEAGRRHPIKKRGGKNARAPANSRRRGCPLGGPADHGR